MVSPESPESILRNLARPLIAYGVPGNEEGCIRRADAHHRLLPGRCRPAGYNLVELSRFAVGIHPLVFESAPRDPGERLWLLFRPHPPTFDGSGCRLGWNGGWLPGCSEADLWPFPQLGAGTDRPAVAGGQFGDQVRCGTPLPPRGYELSDRGVGIGSHQTGGCGGLRREFFDQDHAARTTVWA